MNARPLYLGGTVSLWTAPTERSGVGGFVLREHQRRSVTQPRVAPQALPWVAVAPGPTL
jgi:hypothetical protein